MNDHYLCSTTLCHRTMSFETLWKTKGFVERVERVERLSFNRLVSSKHKLVSGRSYETRKGSDFVRIRPQESHRTPTPRQPATDEMSKTILQAQYIPVGKRGWSLTKKHAKAISQQVRSLPLIISTSDP